MTNEYRVVGDMVDQAQFQLRVNLIYSEQER